MTTRQRWARTRRLDLVMITGQVKLKKLLELQQKANLEILGCLPIYTTKRELWQVLIQEQIKRVRWVLICCLNQRQGPASSTKSQAWPGMWRELSWILTNWKVSIAQPVWGQTRCRPSWRTDLSKQFWIRNQVGCTHFCSKRSKPLNHQSKLGVFTIVNKQCSPKEDLDRQKRNHLEVTITPKTEPSLAFEVEGLLPTNILPDNKNLVQPLTKQALKET